MLTIHVQLCKWFIVKYHCWCTIIHNVFDSGDLNTISSVQNYLKCGDYMREESLRQTFIACKPLVLDFCSHLRYRVESTGAIVTLNSSVSLIFYYCSRLPSDGYECTTFTSFLLLYLLLLSLTKPYFLLCRYFKPTPRCTIDKDLGSCTLYLPKSCPLSPLTVQCEMRIAEFSMSCGMQETS